MDAIAALLAWSRQKSNTLKENADARGDKCQKHTADLGTSEALDMSCAEYIPLPEAAAAFQPLSIRHANSPSKTDEECLTSSEMHSFAPSDASTRSIEKSHSILIPAGAQRHKQILHPAFGRLYGIGLKSRAGFRNILRDIGIDTRGILDVVYLREAACWELMFTSERACNAIRLIIVHRTRGRFTLEALPDISSDSTDALRNVSKYAASVLFQGTQSRSVLHAWIQRRIATVDELERRGALQLSEN